MKKLIVPAVLCVSLILAYIFWLPQKEAVVERTTNVAPATSNSAPAAALEDVGGESLTDEELATIEKSDAEMNRVRERWADERQKIYRRLKVTSDEERKLAEAADVFEGELQTQGESSPKKKISIVDEIDRELQSASQRFDHRTSEILGPQRFEKLVKERDQFNERLRAEGVDSNVGSFW